LLPTKNGKRQTWWNFREEWMPGPTRKVIVEWIADDLDTIERDVRDLTGAELMERLDAICPDASAGTSTSGSPGW
jgi:hypothetical protein